MIIPWQELETETLHNLIREFVLREGTDYGDNEVSLDTKIEQVAQQIKSGDVIIVFSELHDTVDIKPRRALIQDVPK